MTWLAVCGNPIQLSLFQGIEIRDLAYAGKRKLESLGVVPPKRNAQMVKAGDIKGLDLPAGADVLIPPAVQHEIGADALAMMIQTGMLDKDEIAIVTDYGTNAEMALDLQRDRVYRLHRGRARPSKGSRFNTASWRFPAPSAMSSFERRETRPEVSKDLARASATSRSKAGWKLSCSMRK